MMRIDDADQERWNKDDPRSLMKGKQHTTAAGTQHFPSSVSQLFNNQFNRENGGVTLNSSSVLTQPGEQLYMAVKGNDMQTISSLLGSYSDTQLESTDVEILGMSITQIVDNKGNSLLHHAAVNGSFWVFNELIEFWKAQSKIQTPERRNQLIQWLDSKNQAGFGAIHLACFRGSLQIIQRIHELGGDVHLKNQQDLAPIHIACQCDQPLLLVYFISELGVPREIPNQARGTPLHQACFFGSEACVNILLALGSEVSPQDREGFTPLHLAVISGNVRIVRRMVVYGANRTITDNKGQTPCQTAIENNLQQIAELLAPRNKCSLQECYGMKMRPQKANRSRQQLYMFMIFFVLNITYDIFFVFTSGPIGFSFIGVCSVAVLLFFYLWLTEPGFMPQQEGNLYRLLQTCSPDETCSECQIQKPPRSKHCDICNRCVSVYDHHCPWINNCIGTRNHAIFLVFIFSVLAAMIGEIILSILVVFTGHVKEELLLPYHVQVDLGDENYKIVKIVGTCISISICAILLFPLFLLIWVQVGNFLMNKTTYERFNNKKVKRVQNNGSQDVSVFSSSESNNEKEKQDTYMNNCCYMCCLNQRTKQFTVVVNTSTSTAQP